MRGLFTKELIMETWRWIGPMEGISVRFVTNVSIYPDPNSGAFIWCAAAAHYCVAAGAMCIAFCMEDVTDPGTRMIALSM